MKSHVKALWTSGKNTQVAKRKQAAFYRNLTRAAIASMKGEVYFDDFLTFPQMLILRKIAAKHGKEPGEFLHHILTTGINEAKARNTDAA